MKKTALDFWAGLFVVVGLVAVGYLTVKLGKLEILGSGQESYYARFHSVTGLKVGAAVEMAGVAVGKVDAIRYDPAKDAAIVALKLTKGLSLSDDTIASIKTSGLIGDKYVKLSPGGSNRTLRSGELITETESAVDLEELISRYVMGKV
ncbi:MAG: outer membrane lipid asymmetry maintenance protein MlaD [Deltaproteobacteria bacterium]|nr:outer membrane lipid asymmetry maintenance protein MlaD [Deltaproteobacteria bacterium]